ncbi:hypothetical protein ACFLQG_00725, partial [Candidatus Zixiibacteriota bacterium]
TFIVKDTVIGELRSTVKGEKTIDDKTAITVEEKLNLDYTKTSTNLTTDFSNKIYFETSGRFLGLESELTINEATGGLDLERDGDFLKGVSKRGENEIEEKIIFDPDKFAIENNFLDQYELFWAMRDFKVGDVIEDSIFNWQSLSYSKIYAKIESYDYKNLYNKLFDSVFVIIYNQPLEQIHFFTLDNRLVKASIPSIKQKVYLDAVRAPAKSEASRIPAREVPLVETILALLLYFGFGLFSIIFFIKQGYRSWVTYLFFIAGGALFTIIPFTQIPLQGLLIKKLFIPGISSGGSLYLWGLTPALSVGLIQELLKLIGLIVIFKLTDIKSNKYPILGAALGFGFGLVEAAYIAIASGNPDLLNINLLERGFTILFHVASGALIGYALSQRTKTLFIFLIVTMIINSLYRYLPLFVQHKVTTVELLTVMLALISMIFLFSVTFYFKKKL